MPQKFTFQSDPSPRRKARDAEPFTEMILNYPQTLLSVIFRILDDSFYLAGAKTFLSAVAEVIKQYTGVDKNIACSRVFASVAMPNAGSTLQALCNHCKLGKPQV